MNQTPIITAFNEINNARNSLESLKNKYFNSYADKEFNVISGAEFRNTKLIDLDFTFVTFENCKFQNVKLRGCEFKNCTFSNCDFIETELSFISFYECELKRSIFDYGSIDEASFIDCSFQDLYFNYIKSFTGLRFLECDIMDTHLTHMGVDSLIIENIIGEKRTKLSFDQCDINRSTFSCLTLLMKVFVNSKISASSFVNCKISRNAFLGLNVTHDKAYSFIDLQTILKSDLTDEVYSRIFGVYNFFKSYIAEMVSKVELNTVFISYSFQDKELVGKLNRALSERGVFTFLWEKDAPVGKRLKDIMHININKYDKLLFVASKSSLTSEACHYELSEARKKQNKNWDLVYFPVHIDSFLFEVQEHHIPRKHREEFWENILELREVNSLNLCEFNNGSIIEARFGEMIDKLVSGLRRNSKTDNL